MITIFLLLLLTTSCAYGMDPEALASSSSTCKPPAHKADEPVGGWIILPKNLFDGSLPKGTKIAPLEILQLPLMSSPALIYDTYAQGFQHLKQQGEKVVVDQKYLILLIGKQLGLLTPEGSLIQRPSMQSGMPREMAIRCIRLLCLRKTPEEGEQIINLVKQGISDYEICDRFLHNSIALSPTMKHPYKKYLWSLVIALRSILKTSNAHLTITPQRQKELSHDIFRITSNQITDKKGISQVCAKIPSLVAKGSPEVIKLFNDFTQIISKGLEGKSFCLYRPNTMLGKVIKNVLADTKNKKRYPSAHAILVNYYTHKIAHLLMPISVIDAQNNKPINSTSSE